MKKISLLIAALYAGSALAQGAQTIVLLHQGKITVTNNFSGRSMPVTIPGTAVTATSTGTLGKFTGQLPSTDTHTNSGGGKAQGKSSSGQASSGSKGGSSQSAQNGSSSSSSQSNSGGSSGGESSSSNESSSSSSQSSSSSSSGGESSSASNQGGGEASGSTSSGGSAGTISTSDTGGSTGGTSTPTSTGATTGTTTTVTTTTTSVPKQVVTATPTPTTTTTGTSTVNLTNQTATTSTGQTTTIQQSLYGTLAQAAAAAAATAAGATDFSLGLSTSSISSSLSTTSTLISSATSAQTTGNSAVTQANTAQAAYTANGSFADSSAATANTAVQTANSSIQTALAAINPALSTANASVSSANTALGTANTQIAIAGNDLTTISNSQSTLDNATAAAILQKAAIATLLSTPTTLQQAVTVANTAAAQAAALEQAGDLADAQAALSTAQAALNLVTSALAANTAATVANSAATTAATTINGVSNQVASIAGNASTIAANASIAAYNNPAVAGNFIGHFMMPVTGTGGSNLGEAPNNPAQANTNFVLDGTGSLVEARSMSFQVTDPSTATAVTSPISSADIKWSGGTAADTFKLADNSLYGGRWVSPTVTVTDKSTNAVTTYNPADSLWAVLLAPPANYVQSLTGTVTYTLAGNTTPFDAAGVLGTLNSATLTANFTNQTVDASVNLTMPSGAMAGTYAATGTAMPIKTASSVNPAGFSNGTQTVNCTTGSCAAGSTGYSVGLGGSFAGNTASSAGLAYTIWPTGTGAASDMVQGLVAYTTSAAQTVAALAAYNANQIAYAFADPTYYLSFSTGFYNSVGVVPASAITSTNGAPTSIADNTYSCYGCNGNLTLNILGASSPVTGNANSYATTGIQFGRWTVSTGAQSVFNVPLGSQLGAPASWMYGPQGYLDSAIVSGSNTGPLTGTFNYALDGSNTPVDTNSGTKGVLNSASLTADFTNQKVSANLALTMGSTSWSASASGMTLSNAQFSSGTGTLTVDQNSTSCSTCNGYLNGAFTGQNYAGALLSYNLSDNSNVYIEGNAAFTRNVSGNPTVSNATAAPTGQYFVADYGGSLLLASSVTKNTGNVLTAYSMPSITASGMTASYSTNLNCTTCTGNAAGDAANTGIYYGTWDAGTYSNTSTVNWTTAPGQYHWITGPEVGPVYLAQVLTGTLNFTLDGGTAPTNQSGIAGTLNSGSLTVNFDKQTVGIALGLTDNNHTWSVTTPTGNEAPFTGTNGLGNTMFYAYGNGAAATSNTPGNVDVTVDGTNASGSVSGQLTGTGLTGAILNYSLKGTVTTPAAGTENVNGVAAFAAPSASNTAAPYQFIGGAATDAISNSSISTNSSGGIGAGFDAHSRIVAAGGNLTGFDVNPINGSSNPLTLAIGTSTATDTGSDSATGISWGRWQGGTINVTDRVTGTVTPVTLASSLHWISGPIETSPVTLPTSGTFAYTLAGGTHPTDNAGLLGTLNSATLTADFTNQTVNVGVNVTVNGSNMVASATGVPIVQRAAFSADSSIPAGTPGKLTVTCSGTCGASTAGQIAGGFTGSGGTGAGIMYALQRIGGTSPGSIAGVAAFHR